MYSTSYQSDASTEACSSSWKRSLADDNYTIGRASCKFLTLRASLGLCLSFADVQPSMSCPVVDDKR